MPYVWEIMILTLDYTYNPLTHFGRCEYPWCLYGLISALDQILISVSQVCDEKKKLIKRSYTRFTGSPRGLFAFFVD